MKKTNLLILPAVLSILAGTLTSCGGSSNNNEGELYICVYDGGYGTSWIEQLAADYEKKTGVKVHAEADQSILDRMEDQLENGSDYDIYMSHDINWQTFSSRGLLANLDDLYSRQIEGTGKTFEQRLVSYASELSKIEDDKGEEHFYKACYTQGAGGFVYNMDMFAAHNWQVPTTYADLVTLCAKINSDSIEIPGTRQNVVPFAWSGSDRQYFWDYVVFEWWAQLAGMEKINTIRQYKGPTGLYRDGYEMYNPDSYYKEFNEAYKMWHDLVAQHSEYSITDAYGAKLASAQAAFANGEAAMIPYGQWAKLEIENAVNKKLDFDIAMMKTPKAKADSIDVNYMVGFGDSMIIPQNSPNIELAKDFLAYMATYEACKTFVEKSEGAFLAFDYTDVDLKSIEDDNTYIKSMHEKLTSSTNFTLASTNPITYWNVNSVMPWVSNKYFYQKAGSKPSENTPAVVGADLYNTAKTSWPLWLRQADLSD